MSDPSPAGTPASVRPADTPSASDTGSDAASGSGADPASPQRGLLGRLFGALAPAEAPADAERRLDVATRQVLPGLGNLKRLRVADVAIPKAEIVAIPVDIARDPLIEVLRDSGFSRLPVYDETLDRPLGFLLLKDLILKQGFNLREGELALRPLLRPLLYVPPSMPLVVLLQKMQTQRTHMALVIDEYGGVEGLLTIEDLIEQVVGEIDDEHDTEDENLWSSEAPGIWQVQPRALLDDLRSELGIDLREGIEDDNADTLGGLVFVLLGRVPPRGEVIEHPAGHEIEVLDADPRHVKRLRLRIKGGAAALLPDPADPTG